MAGPRFDAVRVIVVSDGERILALAIKAPRHGIPIGKLALYTAVPAFTPIGRCRSSSMSEPTIGATGRTNLCRLAARRVSGADYDDFIEEFVAAVIDRWPDVLLQWEDFAIGNAGRLLELYRDRLCTFNDDIQGTAAAAVGTLMSAINITGVPLIDQRIVLVGAGSAGTGIATLMVKAMVAKGLSEADARRRLFAVDRDGLVMENSAGQFPFAQPRDAIAGWSLREPGRIDLFDVVANVKPTALIGVCGQQGAFTEEAVRMMAEQVDRPVIFPLSNPTSRSEATPQQLLSWTNGRALIGTGSPFAPVEWNGRTMKIDQTNNSYIFPGIGLGVIAVGARRVTDTMFMAAAEALAAMSPARTVNRPLCCPSSTSCESGGRSGRAVAQQAQADGVASQCNGDLRARIRATCGSQHIGRTEKRVRRPQSLNQTVD